MIGFMGTGKTSVGEKLAVRLGRRFLDTDCEIEKTTGETVANIFARLGEKVFRAEENTLAKRLADKSNLVIATGGGMVLNPANVALLRKSGVLILLCAEPDIIYERVKRKKTRPLLAGGSLKENIVRLIKEREKAYRAAADYCIDTSGQGVEQVVERIISVLGDRIK